MAMGERVAFLGLRIVTLCAGQQCDSPFVYILKSTDTRD
jgi:hypothetical protein